MKILELLIIFQDIDKKQNVFKILEEYTYSDLWV